MTFCRVLKCFKQHDIADKENMYIESIEIIEQIYCLLDLQQTPADDSLIFMKIVYFTVFLLKKN